MDTPVQPARLPTNSLRDRLAMASLFAVALLARLPLMRTTMYGDEGHMFLAARDLGRDPDNIFWLTQPPEPFSPFFWYRPLTHLPLWPGAQFGFEEWRLNHLLITSLTPLIAYGILQTLQVRRWIAYPTALVFAVHPLYVTFGTLVFHDGLGTVAFGAALWARVAGRQVLSGFAFLAAVWVEELIIFGVAFLFFLDVVRGTRIGEASLWPLRLTKGQTSYLTALALGPVMLLYSLYLGGRFPGHDGPAGFPLLMDRVFLLLWLMPLLVLGLRWNRSREWALLGLFYPAWYMVYYLAGHAVQVWWMLLPGFLAALGAAVVIDTWCTRAARGSNASRRAAGVAAGLALLLMLQVVAPSDLAWKGRTTMPASGEAGMNLWETYAYQRSRDAELRGLLEHMGPGPYGELFLMDVGWFYLYHPFSSSARLVRFAYSDRVDTFAQDPRAIAYFVEQAEATIVWRTDRPLSLALLEVYEDCQAYENASYVVLRAQPCVGRGDQFDARVGRSWRLNG
jgi:hypothetical protein